MAELLKGKEVADSITEKMTERANALKARGITPCLAMLRLGENDADLSYERNAEKRCEKVGIKVVHFNLPINASKEDVLSAVKQINDDNSIHACLMFRPFPDKEVENLAGRLLDFQKDVDCMTPEALMSVFLGRGNCFAPCTPQGCMDILEHYGIDLEGKNVCVIGRSPVVGKPVSMLLQNKNATVTMCHTKTKNIADIAKASDVLIVAAGHAKTVTKDYVREGQTVIDVGINFVDGKLCGDVDFEAVEPIVKAITPVPGGVGAVTTSVLAKHVIIACEYQNM